ncbi:MAG: hypothetical protein QF566_02060 [Candidatus Thalassarchaeaceae archaeon]|jgi:hypothetical protein|nr:hypothetical protein [Candidatus Thalassarchaeaceae archaeon]
MGRVPRVCAAVAGNPIEHSSTPDLFRIVARFLQKSGHNITFDACEKISNDILVDALAWGHAMNSAITREDKGAYRGRREIWLSLTAPLKHQLPIDSSPEWILGDPMLASVNQMRHDGHVWLAAETDGDGLLMVAEEFGFDFSLKDDLDKPLLCMIGGGSTARACAAAWATASGKIWWEGGRRPLSSRGPWRNSLVDTSDVCDHVGRRLHVDFDQLPGTEAEIIGESMKAENDAPVFLSIPYSGGEFEAVIENEWGVHLNGRWLLVAQHLKAWEYLFFPEATDNLPTLREAMELLSSVEM